MKIPVNYNKNRLALPRNPFHFKIAHERGIGLVVISNFWAILLANFWKDHLWGIVRKLPRLVMASGLGVRGFKGFRSLFYVISGLAKRPSAFFFRVGISGLGRTPSSCPWCSAEFLLVFLFSWISSSTLAWWLTEFLLILTVLESGTLGWWSNLKYLLNFNLKGKCQGFSSVFADWGDSMCKCISSWRSFWPVSSLSPVGASCFLPLWIKKLKNQPRKNPRVSTKRYPTAYPQSPRVPSQASFLYTKVPVLLT